MKIDFNFLHKKKCTICLNYFQSDSYQGIKSRPIKIEGKPTFKIEKQAKLYKELIKNQKKQKKNEKFLRQKKQNEALSRREIKVSFFKIIKKLIIYLF